MELVHYTHFFSSNFCHHGSGGAALDSVPIQQDPYLSPHKDFKLIACSVQELWWSKVELTNCDSAMFLFLTFVYENNKEDVK
jgi:hypothetical protein